MAHVLSVARDIQPAGSFPRDTGTRAIEPPALRPDHRKVPMTAAIHPWRNCVGCRAAPGFVNSIIPAPVPARTVAVSDLSEAVAPEIEVTPAMIEAGVSAFLRYDSRFENEECAVEEICRAMVMVEPRRLSES